MNIILNILFIFLFLYSILYFRIPNVNNDKYIFHKFVIFVAIFCFQFVLLLLSKIKNKCKIDMTQLLQNSFETALYGIVGYSIYNDIAFMNLRKYPGEMFYINPAVSYLLITISITMFVSINKMVHLAMDRNYQRCLVY